MEPALFYLRRGEKLVGTCNAHVDDVLRAGEGPPYEKSKATVKGLVDFDQDENLKFQRCGKFVNQLKGRHGGVESARMCAEHQADSVCAEPQAAAHGAVHPERSVNASKVLRQLVVDATADTAGFILCDFGWADSFRRADGAGLV